MSFKWFQSVYSKIIIGSIMAFLGISLGIYTGFALTGNKIKDPVLPLSKNEVTSIRQMNISAGDLFPNEFFYDSIGNYYDLQVLLEGKNSVLVFSLWGCGPCTDLVSDYLEKMVNHIRPELQVVFIEDKNNFEVPSEHAKQAAQLKIVLVDMVHWATTYELSIWPTIIAVDNGGKIRHIQFGYEGAIEQPLAHFMFKN